MTHFLPPLPELSLQLLAGKKHICFLSAVITIHHPTSPSLGAQVMDQCWFAGREGAGPLGLTIAQPGILSVPVICLRGHKASVKPLAWCCSPSLESGRRLDFGGRTPHHEGPFVRTSMPGRERGVAGLSSSWGCEMETSGLASESKGLCSLPFTHLFHNCLFISATGQALF